MTRLEFQYVNVSRQQEAHAGGSLDFVRMGDGSWAISDWNIRMPVIEENRQPLATGRPDMRVTKILVTGGELHLVRRGADTIWSRGGLSFAGAVVDSSSAHPVPAARVRVANLGVETRSDSLGHFRVAAVIPGDYTLEVRTASLDSVNAIHRAPATLVDSAERLTVRVPDARAIGTRLCGNSGFQNGGAIMGTLVAHDSLIGQDATVTAEWRRTVSDTQHAAAPIERRSVKASAGSFRFCGVPIATSVELRAETRSAGAELVRMSIPSDRRLARAELRLESRLNRPAAFAGIVADTTGRPLEGAQVTLPNLGRGVASNSQGAFRVDNVPPGQHHVVIRRIGYGPVDTVLAFEAGRTTERSVKLLRSTLLDSVLVTASRDDRSMRGFDDHRRIGLGHFFTREDMEKREGRSTAAVLAEVTGLELIHGQRGRAWVRGTRNSRALGGLSTPDKVDLQNGAPRSACYATVYLDGMLMFANRKAFGEFEPLFDVNTIPPEQIEAIEYYAGPAQTPAEYSKLDSPCGVLVIHTRRK